LPRWQVARLLLDAWGSHRIAAVARAGFVVFLALGLWILIVRVLLARR